MTIYFIPTSSLALNDRVFEPYKRRYEGGNYAKDDWARLREAFLKRGINIHTYDLWQKEKASRDDILIVQNHPGEPLLWRLFYFFKSIFKKDRSFVLERSKFFWNNYKYFSRRILIQTETPIAMPYVYRKLKVLKSRGMYNKIFSIIKISGFDHFNYFYYSTGDFTSSYFRDPKDKFLILINSNGMPHSFSRRELFGERLKAIKYFSGIDGFDLYGYGWDRSPRHPFYRFYKKYVDRVWRGVSLNKMKTISQYKFMICYENSSYPGYVSEKILDAIAAGVIPIYLGAPDIMTLVPKSCFIDKRDFKTYEELHRYLLSLKEADFERYRKSMLEFLRHYKRAGIEKFMDQLLK